MKTMTTEELVRAVIADIEAEPEFYDQKRWPSVRVNGDEAYTPDCGCIGHKIQKILQISDSDYTRPPLADLICFALVIDTDEMENLLSGWPELNWDEPFKGQWLETLELDDLRKTKQQAEIAVRYLKHRFLEGK